MGDRDAAPSLFDLDRPALGELLADQPGYRIDQLWSGLYEHALDPAEISTLPKALRRRLSEAAPTALAGVTESTGDGGETTKFLWSLRDGATIETVLD